LEGAKKFAESIDVNAVFVFVESSDGLSTNRFHELSFPTEEDEAGFILIAHALDFGSGFRPQLHKHRGGSGAWLTIRAGLVSLGKENPTCDANWLRSLTRDDIIRHFD
jgi:hypothetical protein